ncbi:MAG: molybdenum cofactor guanylyltransferase [Gammaproteobacteria bacterium]|nr:molybdenum cofactor guanylyltransferase [Gammaproteobacteria bacterium]
MKADKNNTSALILSGGQGRRMNHADKGLLVWKNKMLINHVIDAIKTQLDHIIINANQHHEQYQQLNYELISDSIKGYKGPLSGILSAMQYCEKAEYLLVLPCDCPTPPKNLFRQLAQTLNKNDQANIAIADDGSRLQPLFGLYKTSLLPELESALANEHNKVMKFIEDNNFVTVDYSDQPETFRNFNRPEDMT